MNKQHHHKQLVFICLVIISFVLLATQASAWGVYPVKQHAENNQELQEFYITVTNDEKLTGTFNVGFGGQLAPHAVYNGGAIQFTADKHQVSIPFSLMITEDVAPGENTLRIILEETTADTTSTIGANVALVAEVIVNVPVQGNFITARLDIQPQGIVQPTKINIGVVNIGEATIPIWADVKIKGPTRDILASWTTKEQTITQGSSGGIVTHWEGEKNPGLYTAEVILHYDDKTMTLTKDFAIGDDGLLIQDISTTNFALGSIVPFTVTVYNPWNKERAGAYAEIEVKTKEGNVVDSFKTSPENIQPLQQRTLQGYWDTSKLSVGTYTLNVILHYEGKTNSKEFTVVVGIDSIDIRREFTGQVTRKENQGDLQLYQLIVLLSVVLVIVNGLWIWMARKKVTADEKKKK